MFSKLTYIKIGIIVLMVAIINSCKIGYSFTGASISPNIKTISVDYFPNHALLVNPSLSQTFTEALKDRFVNQTSLELVKDEGDLQFSGAITRYTTTPAAITGDLATQTRLTIIIQVKFVNTKDETQDFDRAFSHYADYPTSESLDAVEDQLISDIVEKITDDIFNKSVSNW